ncbi:MAG: DUF427 domain-containing protein [Ahrensia sp.]|nr:DUF427 domain-containing protein [Ahrensia sp.]
MLEEPITIARPDAPQHFMVLRAVGQPVSIHHQEVTIARSNRAVWLQESGRMLYAPVIYLPKHDLTVDLASKSKSTHCPLKGDASYFALSQEAAAESLGWAYEDPLPFSKVLEGLIAFYGDKVSIRIGQP